MAENSLSNLDLGGMVANQDFFPSPTHWEDEVVYFLMLDRFSNAKESGFRDNNGNSVSAGTTPPLFPAITGMRSGRPPTLQPGGTLELTSSEETSPEWNPS